MPSLSRSTRSNSNRRKRSNAPITYVIVDKSGLIKFVIQFCAAHFQFTTYFHVVNETARSRRTPALPGSSLSDHGVDLQEIIALIVRLVISWR